MYWAEPLRSRLNINGKESLKNSLIKVKEIFISEYFVITSYSIHYTKLYDNSTKWYIPIRVFTDKPFRVTKTELVVSHNSKINIRKFIGGDEKEIYVIKDINQKFDGKGDFSLQFEVLKTASSSMLELILNIIISESSTFFASGKIFV